MISGLLTNYRDPTRVLKKHVEMPMQAELTWLERRYPRYRSPASGLTELDLTKS